MACPSRRNRWTRRVPGAEISPRGTGRARWIPWQSLSGGGLPPRPPRPDTRLLIVSTSMEIPSTSESRMNSCRSSSHFWPVAVRKSIARSHSAMVGSVSLTNACRCLTRLLSSSRSRGSWVFAKLSTTASAAVSSVKSVAMADSVSLAALAALTWGPTPRPPQGHIRDRAQVAQLVGVDHGSDRLYLAVGDVEGEDVDDAPFGVVGDRPRLAVDPGQLDAGAHLRAPAGQPEHEPGDPKRSVERPGRRQGLAASVAHHDHVRREQFEQGGQVAAARRLEEPAGYLLALFSGGLEARLAFVHVMAGPGEDLTAVRLGLADDARDLFVVVAEHLVQQEHGAFGRRQALHQNEEGHRQGVGHLGALGRIGFRPRQERLG